MMAATSAATCPVCREQIEAPVQFALHVAACTTPLDGAAAAPSTAPAAVAAAAAATPTASCPMCHMVYTSAMAAHEIAFHEEECERVNEETVSVVPLRLDVNGGLDGAGGGRPASGAKRSRNHTDTAAAAVAGPTVKLFPAHCTVCDAGGRTLLHCAGSCARSFHPLCVEEINLARDFAANGTAAIVASSSAATPGGSAGAASTGSGNVSFATAITRDKRAQKAWICGECTRGLHTCTLCGFLGHEGHEIVRCSLPDCGFFFHPACLRERNLRALSPLVCPRHTCTACHAIETDMTKCSSCTKCCTSIHLHCRDATGTAATPATTASAHTRGRGDVLDPNFHVCDAHTQDASDSTTASIASPERRAAQYVGLKMHTRPGDIVLILEYGNLLLPSSAKDVAPEAYNQWGIVQRVENLGEGISPAWWTELLTVTLFSDDSSIAVANRYVLPVGSMRQYASPTLMVRDAIKWHALAEIHVRHLEKQRRGVTDAVTSAPVTQSAVLTRIILAFQERAKSLGLSAAECLSNAGEGFATWQRFSSATSLVYLATSAPVYAALDTRGRHKPDMEIAAVGSDLSRQPAQGPQEATGDDDVDMEDASSPSAKGQDSSTSSPSVAGTMKSRSASNSVAHDEVAAEVLEVMARLLEGVDAQLSRGSLLGGSTDSRAKGSLVDVVTSMANDSNNEGDVNMTDVVELPLIHGEEEGSEENENRLSMDDLLNPLSQESVASVAVGHSQSPASMNPRNENGTVQELDVRVGIQKRPLEAMDVDSVNVSDNLDETTAETRQQPRPVTKKPKLAHAMKPPIAVEFSSLPLHLKKPRGSVFGRSPLPVRPALLRKEKLATEYPPLEIRRLARKVEAFFDAEDEYDGRLLKGLSSIRTAFYRPTPFLYRTASRVGRRVDAITRMLLCQDKRNLKCFVRVAPKSAKSTTMRACPYDPSRSTRLSYVSVDLVGVSNFTALEKELRCRVASAVTTKARSTGWHWQSSHGTSVTVEEELREPEIRLTYCAYDGSEHSLPIHKLHHRHHQQPDWLCFCANVVHLTATVMHH